MKKILALVLALVMTMSLATISSGAAFSDADEVRYADAVNTLTALGVLGGYADGSIRPAADVTRGAAAKMVAMVATGSNATTIGYYAGTSTFADVPATHTFADAVAFCVARGIVAGYGDGNYGVADNVKGWAVAKMVLVAMGYDAKAYGMEGTGSALNTITLASALGLFDGMKADFSATAAASREECAQIVYNALTLNGKVAVPVSSTGMVEYKDSGKALIENYGIAVGGEREPAFGTAAKTLMSTGVITANQATTGGYYTTIGTDNYAVETGLDLVGHKVMFCTNGVVDAYNVPEVFAVVDLSTVVTVAADFDKAETFKATFGFAHNDAAITGIASKKVANEFVDYSLVVENLEADPAVVKTQAIDGDAAKAGTYVLCGKEFVSYMTGTTSVGYVSGYSAGTTAADGYVNVTVENRETSYPIETSAASIAANAVTLVSYYSDIAVGDIVLVNKTGDLTTVTKAATVTGKVSAIDNTATAKSITIGGTVYAQSLNMTNAASDVLASAYTSNYIALGDALGKDVVAYVDATGAVFAMVKPAEATTDAGVVYVANAYRVAAADNAYGEAGGYTYYAQCVTMDGKEVSYQINATTYADILSAVEGLDSEDAEVKAAAEADALANEKGLGKVTLAYDSGVKATCATFSSAAGANGAYKFVKGAATSSTALKVASTSDYYASDVKTIYADYTTKTPSVALDTLFVEVKAGVQDLTGAEYYAVLNGSNYDVKYIVKAGFASTTVASTDVVYVAEGIDASEAEGIQTAKTVSYTDAANQAATAYVYSVYVNGTLTEIKATNTSLAAAGFYKYSVDSLTGIATFEGLDSTDTLKLDTDAVVDGLYSTLLSFTDVDDAEAKDAKIVDVRYAFAAAEDKASMVEITSLAGLMPNTTLGEDTGATIAVVYNVNGTAKSVATIYVLRAPYNAP